MSEFAQTSIDDNKQEIDTLRDKYGLPDASEAILNKIAQDLDSGSGIHKGGFIDNADVSKVRVGAGNSTNEELRAVDSIARSSFRADGADPVVNSSDQSLSGLSIERARDAAVGGMTLASTSNGTETRMGFMVLDDQSPRPDRDMGQDKRAVLEKIMFMANGAANPYVVESLSTYGQAEDGVPFNKLESFTMVRREASAAEVVSYYDMQRAQRQSA